MKLNLKMPRQIGGVDYPKGIHEVPDEFRNHWYVLAMLGNGVASLVEDAKPSKVAKVAKPVPKVAEVLSKPVKDEHQAANAATYHDHMAKWESKDDKKDKVPDKVVKKSKGKSNKKAEKTVQ